MEVRFCCRYRINVHAYVQGIWHYVLQALEWRIHFCFVIFIVNIWCEPLTLVHVTWLH